MLLDKKIPLIYIFKKVQKDLLIVTIISIGIYFLHSTIENSLPSLPINIPIFLGTAISLLLSFQLNQSYDRWWEARKVWGSIVNDSRSLVIQLNAFIKPDNTQLIKKMTYRQIAWVYCFGQSLRKQDPLKDLSKYLSEIELENLKSHDNKPLAILNSHSKDLLSLKNRGDLDLFYHVQLDNTLVRLCDAMGKAERIKNTVFPTTYRLFLHFSIYIFIILLSISLSEIDGIFEIPLLIIISLPFLLLEKTAKHMQDPFSNLPTDTSVTAIARVIEINLKQLINDTDIPSPLQNNEFYIN